LQIENVTAKQDYLDEKGGQNSVFGDKATAIDWRKLVGVENNPRQNFKDLRGAEWSKKAA
jgi:hypothetical protein